MDIKVPNYRISGSSASAPKARLAAGRKPAQLRGFSALPGGKHGPPHFPPPPGANRAQPGPFLPGVAPEIGPFPPLGIPLNIREVARMIGCSPWTVRQTLIPRGLPHFRFAANGRLVFYREQVVRWIEKVQGGQKH